MMTMQILQYAKKINIFKTVTLLLLIYTFPVFADVDLPSKFSNSGGIANTRHNMTQSTIGAGAVTMNPYRNDYGEVCVYCHTPHGANSQIDAPLWNRTFANNTYTTYDALGTTTLTSTVSQPGVNSLTCLSCHDGTLAIDSIVNMPGSGGYNVLQESSQDNSFLNQWNNASGADASTHLGLNGVDEASGCLVCHSSSSSIVGSGATDFKVFAIGTDLTNDHPVGVLFPASADFNATTGTKSGLSWYDTDGDSRADSNEIRFYDTGDGPEVECGSCHDPHGTSPLGSGGILNASFLRVKNDGSKVCLTCHIK